MSITRDDTGPEGDGAGHESAVVVERPGAGLAAELAGLSLVLENAPVILYGLDLEGRFLFSEGNGLAAMGLKRGQVVGESAFDLYGDTPGATDAIRAALHGQHSVFRAHFGGAYFVSRLTPVFDDAGVVKQVAGVSVDTGGQMRAEKELSGRSEQVGQSQKMEAVGQLAGGIAHDFNNLLTAIIGYSELVLEKGDCQLDSVRGEVDEIRRAAERAAGLTRQILAFSRRQTLEPKVLSLNDALINIETLLRRTLGDEIELKYVLRPDLGSIEVDPSQLEQAVMNLCRNARDAMSGGGRLCVQTANVELDAEFCWENPECTPALYVLLSVSDTGAGMDEATASRVFEPFFTTKEVGEGTGLGLSTVYGIVRQSGGCILLDSEPGTGTTFKIYFPRVEPEAKKSPIATEPRGAETACAVVLLVEDEPAVRALVTQVLNNEGHVVFAASDASQALALLEETERGIDLLLTDVVLPRGLQGDGLAREARALRPKLPILFMSGHPREALTHSGGLDEGIDFLQKPFTLDSLVCRVRESLDAADR
jgi:two-component system cell cycle sensor histidine kinase/response regulator CckA